MWIIKYTIAGLLTGLLFIIHCNGQAYSNLVVTEIMADPAPVVGLPAVEYLELHNRTNQTISLKNWKLVIGSRTAILPDSLIFPNEYLLLCNRTNQDQLRKFGKVIGITPFSLPNDIGTVSVYSPSNRLIFSIAYQNSWWSAGTRDGGYALEMVDENNPCGEKSNWKVSKNSRGGTPAQRNSISENNPDAEPPIIQRVDVLTATELRLVANERLDSLGAVAGAGFILEGRKIVRKKLESPAFHNLILTLDVPLLIGEGYKLSVNGISDCAGNILRQADFLVGLPQEADSGDVVLNEILFNPPTDGVDFVEIYNRSAKFINLKNWIFANVKDGLPDVTRIITADDFLLAPFTYLAVTTDEENVWQLFQSGKSRNFLQTNFLPSFPNTAGGVILQNAYGQVFDRFDHNENMHDPLIQNTKGVSLEKSDVSKSSGLASNWHSAAFTSGNATPGYVNSQIKAEADKEIFETEPEAFVPANGENVKIKYEMAKAGAIATIRIYDLGGRLVKNLITNQLIGTNGNIQWDGTNEQGQIVSTSYYLILVTIFDADGKKSDYKLKVVVVRN